MRLEAIQKKPRIAAANRGFTCLAMIRDTTGYSAMKSRWMEESTFTPGPMVEESEMLFT